MEAPPLTDPGFWESDAALLLGGEPHAPLPDECAGLVFFRTSGSTGTPKWIGHRRAALLASARAVNTHLHADASSCWALALPWRHVGGFGVLARVREAGCRLTILPGKWNPAEAVERLAREKVTHLPLVPTQVHDLVAAGLRAPRDLRAVVVGGGILPRSTGRAARALGWPVLPSYGMTETASQIATLRPDLLHLPYETGPLDLIDPWEAGTTGDGRLEVRGPSLFEGTLVPEGSGWKYEKRRGERFVTSDIGSAGGRTLTVAGRADTLVKILGELVDPVAAEAELLAAADLPPGAAAVVAVPDERAGARLVLAHGPELDPRQAETLIAAYNARCPGFRRIVAAVAFPEIPKSPLGKPLRALLTERTALRMN